MISVSGAYFLNPMGLALALCSFGCGIVSIYLFQFKRSPGTRYLALMEAANAVWCIFYCLEYSSVDLSLRLFWSRLSYFGIIFTTLYFYFFTLHFFREKPISSKLKVTLIIFSLLPIIGVLTNDYHHLHWKSAIVSQENNTTIYHYGPLFWLTFLYTYSLLALGVVNMLKLLRRGPKQIYSSIRRIILACMIPVIGNILYVFKINPVPGFDWTPICFLISGIILTYINVRYNTFDLVPLAREKLIELWEDGILVVDQQMRIVDFNQAFLTLTQKNRNELVLGNDLILAFPRQKKLLDKIIKSNSSWQKEIEIDLKPGKKYLELRSNPLNDKNNIFWGTLFIIRDITARKKNETAIIQANDHLKEEIAEKEKLIGDLNAFAHTVAHDLRDSIGSIASLSDLIQNEIEEEHYQSISELNRIVYHSANKTFHIIKELLVLATVRQDHIFRQDVNMENVIRECENRLQEMIKQTKAIIRKPAKWPVIKANPAWLEEVWVNYMGNAIKYGGIPPVIELGAEQLYGENKVKFWIKDNGKGIPLKDQKRLFNQFTRLETTRAQGTGLGLSIVKRIIEKLGGQVGVFSNAIPGEGCLFYFILPYN
jgi:PAS domain S-box-containing protein